MSPYGHMLTTLDAATQLHALKMISTRELRQMKRWLNSLPKSPATTLLVETPPELRSAMAKVWLASLIPATWTVQ